MDEQLGLYFWSLQTFIPPVSSWQKIVLQWLLKGIASWQTAVVLLSLNLFFIRDAM